MEILQRPHPSIEGISEMVLSYGEGREVHLLTVSDFCRHQARQMRADLEQYGYRYVARYVNNGGPRDLHEFLALIEPGSRLGRTMKLEFVRGCWQFWGDLRQMGFCFLILDEDDLYQVMTKLGVSEESQLREFMRRRAFKAEPRIREENRVYFRAASTEATRPVLPAAFHQEDESHWTISKLGVSLSIKDGMLEIVRSLFQKQGAHGSVPLASPTGS
ncbi:hypothetical protein QU487_06700 [Crenobacter sp. SG2305]|uniref:hypothetical protein n=1 Tax=Crenobacter oryzisoli TaxID=3056844 RepID=UPI0025AB20AA|nr:hypothetical protein [Crenobacter sp. SG2305]MDN0082443.1 hypothetical protein [Crenobacter sp. SG2305]